jgi:hypothetical protein
MNEDYLWDKSGEPDPDIEQLEQTLGRLRYKRPLEPLPLPAPSRWSFRQSFSPRLAAAAALLVLLLAGGIWLSLRRSSPATVATPVATKEVPEEKRSEPQQYEASGPRPPLGSGSPIESRLASGGDKPRAVEQEAVTPRKPLPRQFSGTRQLLARQRDAKASTQREQISRREGEQAKAQLILALHIASDKLSTVQKKIQANQGT